ncbi:MAG: hypothetical protein WCA56_22040 [Xanthobacteraceae bacterium]
MSRPKTERATRLVAAAVAAAAFGGLLAGCSDLFVPRQGQPYLERRDTVVLGAGDAVAANTVEQMVDPWPPESGNKNIGFNGQKMQSAAERYRTGKIIPPADPDNFMSSNQSGQSISQTTVNTGAAAPPVTPGQ